MYIWSRGRQSSKPKQGRGLSISWDGNFVTESAGYTPEQCAAHQHLGGTNSSIHHVNLSGPKTFNTDVEKNDDTCSQIKSREMILPLNRADSV
jgi:hypothetical protein